MLACFEFHDFGSQAKAPVLPGDDQSHGFQQAASALGACGSSRVLRQAKSQLDKRAGPPRVRLKVVAFARHPAVVRMPVVRCVLSPTTAQMTDVTKALWSNWGCSFLGMRCFTRFKPLDFACGAAPAMGR